MRIRSSKAGFSLLEIVVAAGLLGLGLLSFVRVFPFGLKVSQRVEDVTRASILAQTMFEGLKADSRDFPIIPGDPITLVPLPGDGFDNDGDWGLAYRTTPSVVDLNNNGRPDSDFDGYGEATKFQGNGVDDDGDGVIDDTGDGMRAAAGGVQNSQAHPISYMVSTFIQPDGNFTYDPEPYVDEEWANGGDDDRDGLIDEDSALSTSQQTPLFAAVRASGFNLSKYVGYDTGRRPLAAGDGLDNDGNGELDQKKYNDPDDANDEYVFDEVHDKGIRRANGVDDNNDGVIDEFIDDRVFGRGLFNLSDTELARFPWSPMRFPAPNERYAWQIYTGPVSDTDVPPELATVFRGRYVTGNLGNGVDEDGDGAIDEELRDGVDNDGDGRIDEDCIASALPGWLKVVIVISWGGDGLNNDASGSNCGAPTDTAQSEPPAGREEIPDCAVDPSVALRWHTPNYPSNLIQGKLVSRKAPRFGHIAWGIDEELRDGKDDDGDGFVDEDVHEFEYRLTGFISLRDRERSFPVLSAR